jgi:cbb3-type cytochrome oxidase subunit 1
MGIAALIAAIISGFGFAIGYGMAVALARKIPEMAEKVRWAVIWRTAPARIFAVVTFGFGIIGLLCGWGLYLLKRKRKERIDNFIASISAPRQG